ncbi:MAG: AMP-binding protein [Clostridia bacterium]|nr:AMP-binding protein [Clostridia bacterium]MCR4906029.1 AMP-binding protein [Clostridiales bacterium]
MKELKNYPLYEVTPVHSVRELLKIAGDEAADKIAFRYRVDASTIRDITYREFIRDVHALGSALTEKGLIDGHIAQIGENSYRWITVYLAALAGDGVYVPVDKDLPEADILNILNHSDSTVLFYSETYDDIVKRNADGALSRIKLFVRVVNDDLKSEEDCRADYFGEDPRFVSYRDFIAHGHALLDEGYDKYDAHVSGEYDLKMIVYTSGTTGMAKGVMLSEHNLISIVYYGLQVSTVYETCLSVLPYHHTYEAVAGLLVSLHHHSTICINENLSLVLKNLNTYKPDYIYLVPAFAEVFYRKIWQTAEKSGKAGALRGLIKTSNGLRKVGIDMRKKFFKTIHQNFGGNLRKIVCGGAPIRPEIGEFFDAIGIDLINGYGITECSPLVAANRDYFNDWNTVGSVLPCVELRFDDVTPEGIGEICVKGDIVMLGYYKQPEATAQVLTEDGWFSTGDYGTMNERGQLIITGRKKNIIVLANGKNIYPEEIENYIQNIPYVKEVVVYSLRNEHGEEVKLCAEVFLNDEKVEEMALTDPAASLKDDIAKATAALPSYKQIAKIVIRQKEFEKTTTNKIKRQSITGSTQA